MRDVIVLLVIFTLVFGGDVFLKNYLAMSSKDLLNHFEEMSGDFGKNYKDKLDKVEDILLTWEDKEHIWIIFEYHDSINDIEDLVIEAYSYYLNGDKEEFDMAYKKLKRLIDDLKNRIDLSLENVL